MYENILSAHSSGNSLLAVLIDPDKNNELEQQCADIRQGDADLIFIGSSLLLENEFDQYCREIKLLVPEIPLILFPGSAMQLSTVADALLFLSVISSRNADMIIGQQVMASPIIKKMGLEAISTGYMLIESGNLTSAQYMSHSLPIPCEKPEIAVAHAMAAEIIGFKTIYLEAGSGAKYPVPVEMIGAIRKATNIPIIVGGGIRKPVEAKKRAAAGASIVVIGTHFENNNGGELIKEFADAVHGVKVK